MAKRLIPFPHLDPAAEPEPIVKHRREIMIRLGSGRYAIDITTSARPLPPEPAKVEMFPRKSKPASDATRVEAAERSFHWQRLILTLTDPQLPILNNEYRSRVVCRPMSDLMVPGPYESRPETIADNDP